MFENGNTFDELLAVIINVYVLAVKPKVSGNTHIILCINGQLLASVGHSRDSQWLINALWVF